MMYTSLLKVLTLALIVSAIGAIFFLIPLKKKSAPPPFETIIVEDGEDENHLIKKEAWVEQMHRSAPGDNWRNMDISYRLNRLSYHRDNNALPVYGKWRELGSNNQAGRTVFTFFDQDTDELYVAADGGQIWKGTVGTENWEPINDHFKIAGIRNICKIATPDYSRLLVHTAGWNRVGILYSDDDGQNWSLANGLEGITSWGYVKRSVVQQDDTKTIYCIAQEWDYVNWHAISSLYRSTDHGESFVQLHTFDYGVGFVDIWTSTTSESPVYLLAKNTFYSIDASGNLNSLANLPIADEGSSLLTGFDDGNDLTFYAMVRVNNVSHFYSSVLNGQIWQATGTQSQGPFMVNSFAASGSEKDVLYFGGMEAFVSANAGNTWIKVNDWTQYYNSPEDKLHADIPAFNSYVDSQGNEILFINTDGGSYISYDQTQTVSNLSMNNLRVSQYYSSYTCRFNPAFTHAGSQDQGYQRSGDGMNAGPINYEQIISGDYGNIVSGDDGASIWMVYPGFAMYAPDINHTNALIFEDFVGSNFQWIPKLMADPSDPERVFLAGGHVNSGAHIMLLERSGYTISTTELPFDFSNGTDANISAMEYSPINTDYRYVLTSEKDFFYSTDAGSSWTLTDGFEGPGSHYFYGAGLAPSNTTLGLLYVAGAGYSNPGVYRSTDNGLTFEPFADGLPSTMVFDIGLSADDSLLFAATEVGAFVCKTNEAQWYALADEVVPDQAFWAVDMVDTLRLARFSTYGRGVWDFEMNPDVVADFTADLVAINSGETVHFYDSSDFRPISWDWYFEGGLPETSTDQHPSEIYYASEGTYDVQLIVSNDHSTDTLLKTDYISVGTVSSPENAAIQAALYPNPASDYCQLVADVPIDRLVIYTPGGRLCKTISGPFAAGSSIQIDLGNLEKGLYLIRLYSGQKRKLLKLVKL